MATSCEYCGGPIDPETEECLGCLEAFTRARDRMVRGDWRAALAPAGPWQSREDLIRVGFTD